jgi:TonB family protein
MISRFWYLLAVAALAAASAAMAQPTLRLVDPILIVGTERLAAAGVTIDQPRFRYLDIEVPGTGRYVVSDRPFTGARRAGDFDGENLAFTVDGRSVRVVSTQPILSATALHPAYARFFPAQGSQLGRRGRREVRFYASSESVSVAGGARVAGAQGVRASGRGVSDDPNAQALAERNARLAAMDAQRDRLEADLARARAERNAAAAERRLQSDARPADPSGRPGGWNTEHAARHEALTAELARVTAERDALRARVLAAEAGSHAATPDEVTLLRAQLARAEAARVEALRSRDSLLTARSHAGGNDPLAAENARAADRAAAEVVALRTELDLMEAELERVRAERDAIRAGARTAAPLDLADRRQGPGFDEPGGRLAISLPDFDYGRLQNVDEIRTAMAETLMRPDALEGHSTGEVLVMFVTDTTGQVTRTEIARGTTPMVDEAAERIVARMRIVPPRVDGRPAVLRSQVLVRFSR